MNKDVYYLAISVCRRIDFERFANETSGCIDAVVSIKANRVL